VDKIVPVDKGVDQKLFEDQQLYLRDAGSVYTATGVLHHVMVWNIERAKVAVIS
jgi:hypothetical protein